VALANLPYINVLNNKTDCNFVEYNNMKHCVHFTVHNFTQLCTLSFASFWRFNRSPFYVFIPVLISSFCLLDCCRRSFHQYTTISPSVFILLSLTFFLGGGRRIPYPSRSVPCILPSIPIRSMAPIADIGSGGTHKLPSGPGRSPAAKRILMHFEHKVAPFRLFNDE